LSFGTATFGGKGEFFKAWGSTEAKEATRLIDVCLDHGVSMFDTADVYSAGTSEEVLGAAIKGKREKLLISTKATFPMGDGPNDFGSSRQHLLETVHGSLKRLGTDRIDLLQLHGQDYNAGRGDAGDARPAGARGQGPLHRRLQFLRLASDEVAGGGGQARLPAPCRASGLLLAAQPRL
jgi:aryl-alcohol dehydrogenase-like predicted oxidoreductase